MVDLNDVVERGKAPRLERVTEADPRLMERALSRPVTRHLVVASAGLIRDVIDHTLTRPSGHPHTIVCVCSEGSGWLQVGGRTHVVEAGTAFALAPRTPHVNGSDDPPWTVWYITLLGTGVSELLAALGATVTSPVFRIPSLGRIVALFDEILTGCENNRTSAQIVEASGLAWRVLTLMAIDRFRPGADDPLVAAMRHIADHLEDRVTVTELARRVGLSPSRLTARFRAETGGGVIAYQIHLRMAKAARLIDGSTRAIREIAREVGYTDQLYFSRQFHRVHGMSPTAYRERGRR